MWEPIVNNLNQLIYFFKKRDKNCKVSDVEYNFPSRISLHFQYSENQPVAIFDINVM